MPHDLWPLWDRCALQDASAHAAVVPYAALAEAVAAGVNIWCAAIATAAVWALVVVGPLGEADALDAFGALCDAEPIPSTPSIQARDVAQAALAELSQASPNFQN